MEEEKREVVFFLKKFQKNRRYRLVLLVFPAEMSEWPPRTYVERIFNITQWTEMTQWRSFCSNGTTRFISKRY